MSESTQDPAGRSDHGHDTTVPGAALGGTGTLRYPGIAADKYDAALDRVAAVHRRFRGEIESMAAEIRTQSELSRTAIGHCRRVGPCLEAMGGGMEGIGESVLRAAALVDRGREGLKTAVSEVRSLIDRLGERNRGMQSILEIGREVTGSVDLIAETAVENRLIATNAAVTASKAGDRAKGFKVIAAEVSRISAGMADRVQAVVQHAARVDSRMQAIMDTMEAGIRSTQDALGSIDRAFSLLDAIDGSIRAAVSTNAGMLGMNRGLASEDRAIGESLAGMSDGVAAIGAGADALDATMREQEGNIASVGSALPGLRSACEALAREGDTPAGDGDRLARDGDRLARDGEREPPKILRMAESALTGYDPARTRMLREIHLTSFTCIRLLRYSSDGRIVPYLAETWFLQPDGRTWEFTLKRNVRFHDGSPVSSRDVKFSLERLMNPALESPYANLFAIIEGADAFMSGRERSVRGIRLMGDHALAITLKSSFNYFLSLLALGYSAVVKEDPAHFSVPLDRDGIVSAGPFRLLPGGDGSVDRLVANPHFVNGRPFLDAMEISRTPVDTVRALADGELDLAYNLTAAKGRELAARGFDGASRHYTSRYCYGLVVNFTRDNFLTRHRELRRAVCMAFDKDGLIRDVLGGNGVRADTVLSPEVLDAGDGARIAHDPAAARAVVDGFRSSEDLSRPVTVVIRDYPSLPDIPAIERRIRETFENMGLRAVTAIRPLGDALASFAPEYDLVFAGFLSELDLYSAVEPFINPTGGDNYFGYDNPAIFRMLEDSITVTDAEERARRFVDILEALGRDVFMVPLFFQKVLCVSGRQVRSVFMGPEETIIPDAIYLSAGGGTAAGRDGLEPYSAAVDALDARVSALVGLSRGLIGSGRALGASIAEQKAGIAAVNGLFARFEESAGEVRRARDGMVGAIRETAVQAASSGSVTRLIREGLDGLHATVDATCRSLDQVKRDIKLMTGVVREIAESNGFISSVAINAAIIAAKSDRGDGDLRKVSQSIAGQAARNTEYTAGMAAALERMDLAAGEHLEALAGIASRLAFASRGVGEGGGVLGGVGPLLETAVARCADIEREAAALAAALDDARRAVDDINRAAGSLAVHADTLRFGLDLEQAVADILGDVAGINREIRDWLASG